MSGLEDAAERIGAAGAEAIAVRIAAEADALPGVSATRDGADVTLSARALGRRRIVEPLLRVIGALLWGRR